MSTPKTLYRKIFGSRTGIRLLLPLLGLALACGVGLSARTGSREARVITLTARDMAFYQSGDPTPNPTLVVRRGERVRLTLTNEDRGMTHDFAVRSMDVATRALRGGTDSLVFEAPERPGESEYVCTYHARMMKGVLKVE
ncbi:MAG TPA: cupredoxin domain-containing protein [Gemmatimonadales bacterium]|nr:cupredoxin domain-containing protein [Gemmatimonadales bacterium]